MISSQGDRAKGREILVLFVNKKNQKTLEYIRIGTGTSAIRRSVRSGDRGRTGPATTGDKVFLLLFVHKKKTFCLLFARLTLVPTVGFYPLERFPPEWNYSSVRKPL